MSSGPLNQISFKKESTWGTPVVPDKSIPVHYTGGIQTDMDVQMVEGMKAQIAKNIDAFGGARKHEGEYELDLFPDYAGYLLLTAFGNVSSVVKAGETIVYEHTFTEVETKPSLTIEQVIGENVRRYAGAIASSIKLSGDVGETIILNAGIKAKSQASATKITPAYTTVKPLNWTQVQVSIGGSQLPEVRNFELEYNNNLEMLHTLNNSPDPTYNYIKASEVNGSMDIYLDSTTLAEYNNYLNGVNRSIDIVVIGGTIGNSSNYRLDINIPVARFTAAETAINDDYNNLSIEFGGIYDTVTAKLLSMKLTNLLSAYN